MPSSRRDQLVETATGLFQVNGFHATGIDKILATADVAKMTLYNHFKSKDELILAALRRGDEGFRDWLMRTVERRAYRPRARLLALFDALDEWFRGPSFHGCMFVNAAAEYGEPDDPVHAVAAEHKRLVLNYVRELAADAEAADADGLAQELELLIEGAIAVAYVRGDQDAAARAKRCAAAVIERALAPPPQP